MIKIESVNNFVPGSVESPRPDANDNAACETENNCTFDIGWSSVSILYTFVRPDFILSLQPAWFLNSLKFSIDEHVGFSRNVTLYVSIQRDTLRLPKNKTVTAHEIMHFLQRATAKVIIITIMLLVFICFLLTD